MLWEDDFCDDPLLAILGQLSEYFKEGKLKEYASEFFRIAGTLLKQNALSVLHALHWIDGGTRGKGTASERPPAGIPRPESNKG